MENKTGKYLKYALGEILLVMIGILLALQVSNWNQERKDRISERKILDNIHRDFIQNKRFLDTVKVIQNKNVAAVDSMIAQSLKGKLTEERFFEYRKNLKGITYNAYSSTVDAVINSNALELIQDRELQKYLVSWRDVLLDFTEEETAFYNFMNQQYRPYLLANIDFSRKNTTMSTKALSTVELQNRLIMVKILINGILEAIEEEPIQNHINEIIRLTQPNI